ncbi:hypothetical protein H8R18_00775 [Nanchangia anserum]|uniref:Uncharacterized protein n=1 Tax=Nanchangia anserum TaxID=2692125 RepID=A0A8I0G8C7_9ACTO|nr:hypothetical protein [Nanchangia anserum]MBD3689775.1 hypothetical protein [Nanchangia anserum]QOX81949.1 hypothetical protein H8R18_00775 [Nanchangia anserum]
MRPNAATIEVIGPNRVNLTWAGTTLPRTLPEALTTLADAARAKARTITCTWLESGTKHWLTIDEDQIIGIRHNRPTRRRYKSHAGDKDLTLAAFIDHYTPHTPAPPPALPAPTQANPADWLDQLGITPTPVHTPHADKSQPIQQSGQSQPHQPAQPETPTPPGQTSPQATPNQDSPTMPAKPAKPDGSVFVNANTANDHTPPPEGDPSEGDNKGEGEWGIDYERMSADIKAGRAQPLLDAITAYFLNDIHTRENKQEQSL